VDLVLVEPFTRDLAALSPESFFDRYLVEGLKAKSLHVGFDFMFGRGRAGNTQVLEDLSKNRAIELQVESPIQLRGERISSSRIRDLIREGEVGDAADFLGRPYSLGGQVVHGDHRGAGLGFPTANLHYPAEKVLPLNGVYVTRAIWQKQTFLSVTNVGVRPTFDTHDGPTVEVHLLDFGARLYDELIQLEFLARIRDEKRFASVEALKRQIQSDVKYARSFGEVVK
jgi:riboflavin kinase/FMN adenylyltransferase